MDAIAALATPAIVEGLKNWGVFTLLLLGLGIALWRSESRSAAKDKQIEALLAENGKLQDLRVQDAREMIRVAETGTATMAARAEGDARFRDLFTALVTQVSQLTALGPKNKGARPSSLDGPETP